MSAGIAPPFRVIEHQFDRIETAPGSGGTLTRSLTHSLDYSKEGLAMNATRTCSVDGCSRTHKARGYCASHYARWRESTPASQRARPSDKDRFWAKVDRAGGPDDCWTYLGCTNGQGYGLFGAEGRIFRAHRFAYRIHTGSDPAGLIDHTCHNGTGCRGGSQCPHRACVNPAHLEVVSLQENVRRGEAGKHKSPKRFATECVHGHAYDEQNTYKDHRGYQQCRTCNRDRARARARNQTQKAG